MIKVIDDKQIDEIQRAMLIAVVNHFLDNYPKKSSIHLDEFIDNLREHMDAEHIPQKYIEPYITHATEFIRLQCNAFNIPEVNKEIMNGLQISTVEYINNLGEY